MRNQRSFRGPTSNKWCLDKDDGSSQYWERDNLLLYGAIKDRDGLSRNHTGNLILWPDKMPFADTTNTDTAMAFQVNGYEWDLFVNNTVVTASGSVYQCTGSFSNESTATTANNTFLVPSAKTDSFTQNCVPHVTGFAAWQAAGYDAGSTYSNEPTSSQQLLGMARKILLLL